MDKPIFDERDIVKQIMDEIDIGNFAGFNADFNSMGRTIKRKGKEGYHIFHNSDEQLAIELANKLTEIGADIQIKQAITEYRKVKNTKDKNDDKFYSQLKELIKDIELGTEYLQGWCDGCLKFHDEKDIPQ